MSDDTKFWSSSDECPVCYSADLMPSASERSGWPIACGNCDYPLVTTACDESVGKVKFEPASWEKDNRVLAWARGALDARRERDKAVSLLHIVFDSNDAMRPDVAAFLDSLQSRRDEDVG